MRINLSTILQKNKGLFIALAAISLVLCIPVPTPTTSFEENPDDSYAFSLTKDTPVSFRVELPSSGVSAIALWTGDTIKSPLTTLLEVQIDGTTTTYTFKDLLTDERKITIPLSGFHEHSMEIQITAPSLDSKKALLFRTQEGNKGAPAYTIYKRTPFILALMSKLTNHNAVADDIEYVWRDGEAISKGENPYKKALVSEHRDNKYSTYLPLSYIVSAGIQKLGFTTFDSWLTVVRPLVLGAQLLTALFVLFFLYSKNKLALGVVSFFVILLHRFTLYPARVYHIDFPAIMFLILGMMLISKRMKWGYVMIGISLAIKQVAVILVPIFLIWEFHQHRSLKKTFFSLLLMMIIPVLSIVPFVISSPEGVQASLAFSTNRMAGGDFATPEIATLLSLPGSFTRIIMYALIAVTYLAFWRKEVALFGASLAILTIFLGFNPVLFFQYLAWVIPFIPLAIAENTTPYRSR